MKSYPQVPGISHGPQSFSKASSPPIQNPMAIPPAGQPGADIAELMQDLAIEIYSGLAIDRISQGQASPVAFRDSAIQARAAAQAYFESMGVKFDG